ALLTHFPDTTPDIVEFFQSGARRAAALTTQTSCTFAYRAQTRPMVTEVLAEAQREEDNKARTLAASGRPMQPAAPPPPALVPPAQPADVDRAPQTLLFGGSGGQYEVEAQTRDDAEQNAAPPTLRSVLRAAPGGVRGGGGAAGQSVDRRAYNAQTRQ